MQLSPASAPETDLTTKGKLVQIGDLVTVFLRKTKVSEKEDEAKESSPQDMFLIAEGKGDSNIYLEPAHVNTQVFRSLFRIEKAKQTPVEASNAMRRDVSRQVQKTSDEEEDKGKPVVYGDQITLRHLHSEKLLAFVSEPKWEVQLAPLGPHARFILTVQSVSIHSSVGDIVKYQDSFSLVFKEKNVTQFLTQKTGGLDSVHLLCTSIAQTCTCKFNVYQPFEQEPEPAMQYGSLVTISSKKLKMFMTGTKVKEDPTKVSLIEVKSVTTLKALDYSGAWKAVLTHTKDADSLWIIENKERFTGGPIHKGDKFHLKHASSEQYLGKDFNLYPTAPSDFWFSTPGVKRGGVDMPLRTPDTVILLTSDDQGFQAEQENTLEHFWQDMIASRQQGVQASVGKFSVNLKAVTQVQEAEENQFDIAEAVDEEMEFYKSILGYRSKLAEARAYLDGYQKIQKEGAYLLLRVNEYVGSFVFPKVTSSLATMVSTLKGAKTAEHLTKLQGILVDLKMHKEILSILSGLISLEKITRKERTEEVAEMQEKLLKECQNAMQMICSKNRLSCATILTDSYTTMINILITDPDRFHELLSTIMDATELEHNVHNYFIDGMIEVLEKKIATEGISGTNSILKTLERMCKGVGNRFDGYRQKVFEFLDKKGITSSLIIFKHEDCFVTCILDKEEPHYFSLHTQDLVESGFFNYFVNYLSLITIICEDDIKRTGNCEVSKYIGLTFNEIKELAESQTTSFNMRSILLRLLSVLCIYEKTSQAEYEDELEKNCWLYAHETEKSYEEAAFTLFRDTSQEMNPTLTGIEALKRMEFLFWVSDGTPAAIRVEDVKQSEHFIEYITSHLEVVHALLTNGHLQRYYIAAISQALSDALIGLIWGEVIRRGDKKLDTQGEEAPEEAPSAARYSTHWTNGLYSTSAAGVQKEGQRFKLQKLYYQFILLLSQMITKSKMRKISELLTGVPLQTQENRVPFARKLIERNWVIEDMSRYVELNVDLERLIADDGLPTLTINYLKKLKDKRINFVELFIEMMAEKSPFLDDNTAMYDLVKAINSQESDLVEAILNLEPMTERLYRDICDSINYLDASAESGSFSTSKSEINEHLLKLCGTLHNTYSRSVQERLSLFKHMQVTLRKLGISQILKKYWKICFENRQEKDTETKTIISRVLALSRYYVEDSVNNTIDFLRSLDWKYYFGQYCEFHEFMQSVGFVIHLGFGNLLQIVINAVHISDMDISTQILKFVHLCLERDAEKEQLKALIANVLRQMIDEFLLLRVRVEPHIASNIIFMAHAVLRENREAEKIFEQTIKDLNARVSSGDDSFTTLRDFFAHQQSESESKRLKKLVEYNIEEDMLGFRRAMSDEADPKVSFLSSLRFGIKFLQGSASFDEQMASAIIQKFKSNSTTNAKSKQFKGFVSACCNSFLSRSQDTFVFNLLRRLIEESEKLGTPAEGEISITARLKSLYWDYSVIEISYRVIISEPKVEVKMAALKLLNTFVNGEDAEFRERMVLFLKESDHFYPFFNKCLDLTAKFKEYFSSSSTLKLQTKGSQMTALMASKTKIESSKNAGNLPVSSTKSLEMLKLYLQFFRYMSDVCFVSFQNLLRTQDSYSGLTVNMVAHLTIFLAEAAGYFEDGETGEIIAPVLTEALQALSEAVSGPNLLNQILVGSNGRTYAALHRIISIVQLGNKAVLQDLHLASLGLFKALMECKDEPPQQVKKAMSKALTSTFESGQRIPRWETLFIGIKSIYDNEIGLPENEKLAILGTDPQKEKTMSIGISQCILLVRLEKIIKDKALTERMQGDDHCLDFYLRFIGYVEIAKKAADSEDVEIFDLYFPIPFEAKFLTLMTEGLLIENARRTSQQDKIDSFISKLSSCKREMEHQQYISRFTRLKALTQNWELCSSLSFVLVALINIMLLCFTTGYNADTGRLVMIPEVELVVFSLALVQVTVKMGAGLGFLVEYWTHLETIFKKKVEINITDYYRMSDKDSQYISNKFSSQLSGGADGAENLGGMMQASFYFYNYVYYVLMLTAVFDYKIYPLLLMDIIYQFTSLITILKAITLNAKTLILTAIFAVVIVFVFTTVSFIYFRTYYDPDSNMFCENLFECFWTTLYFGLRAGGGIGDFLVQSGPKDYWLRMVYDMFFYVVIIIIMLNIVFGIIIDTFGDLRDRKREAEEDINNVCFICGQDRNIIDLRGEGWMTHFMSIHSPFAYLSFLVYLNKLSVEDCTGLEKYVKEMLEKKDTSYFPSTSKAINVAAEGS